MPKVSVIMPVYNCESFLDESINSILQQTFTDIEFIIVDDASADQSWDMILDYATQDKRIVPIRHKINKGTNEARNTGLLKAHSEYVAVQDADDISLPNRLSIQVAYLDTHPHAGAVASEAKRIDSHNNILSTWHIPKDAEMIRALLMLNCPLPHTTMMARREIVQRLGGYKFSRGNDDYYLWWQLSRITEIHPISEVLAHYRADEQDTRRLSVGRAREQLEGSQEISLKIAREIMQSSYLDEDAYNRFFMSSRGIRGSLKRGDIHRLQTLWDTLAADPLYRRAIGPKLLMCSLKNARSQPIEAFNLLLITKQKFQITWLLIFKRAVRFYLFDTVNAQAKRKNVSLADG